MDAVLVNRMLEQRVRDLAGHSPGGSPEERRRRLRKCLGLEPWPAPAQLSVLSTGVVRDGYRIEKLRYESSPGVPVFAHLYLADGEEKRPLIVRPHDHWPYGMKTPVVQASAISLALHGFACLVIASPGIAGAPKGGDPPDDNDLNERRAMGAHANPFLAMGSPVQGRAVLDIVRGIDAMAGRADIDMAHVGITGEGTAADTATYAYALDARISAAVVVAGVESREMFPSLGCACRDVPGISQVGDRADILALRAPLGACMILAADDDQEYPVEGHERTYEKLRRAYRGRGTERRHRFERFFDGHDYNRRMREAALAFFREHLCGGPSTPLCPEARPLTDGYRNPYPSGTVDPGDPELEVSSPDRRETRTFWQLLEESLDPPSPEAYDFEHHFVTWRKYGALPSIRPGAIFAIHDSTVKSPGEPGSVALPDDEVNIRLCSLLGLSAAETLAQTLHFALPGGPESWESSGSGMSPDPLTSMIASMRTLVSTPEAPPKMVVAEGPVASMVARFLARYRPGLTVQATHVWTSWREAMTEGLAANAQPLARYLEWI